MLLELIDSDVVLRVGIVEELLLVRVGIRRVDITKLTQTIGRTVSEHVDDTAGAHVVATGTLVTTESELRIDLERELVAQLHLGLDIYHSTANTGTEDDTLVLTVGDRSIELHILRTTTDSNVGRVVDRILAHHLILPVVGIQSAVHIEVVRVAEVGTEELGIA